MIDTSAWQTIDFISDLHLQVAEPATAKAWFDYMASTEGSQADAIFILGDWFEVWVGDDDEDPFAALCAAVMRQRSKRSELFIMHGNRDFLMGVDLAARCGATLLADPTQLDFNGTSYLLTHGDALCTDDTAYQNFRKQVREPAWRNNFLAQPLEQRKTQIEQLRKMSNDQKQTKPVEIMDVNLAAVADLLRAYHYPRLIHGHTHRQKHHLHEVDGRICDRWVLGDWHETGNALRCDSTGCVQTTV